MDSKVLLFGFLFCCYHAIKGNGDVTVKINEETYSVMETPPETSDVVESEIERILHQINLKQLADDLKLVGTFIRIAYNGVNDFPKIQGKVQSMAIRVTKLGDKSAVTALEFERACETVLDALQAAYQYLLNDMEGVAQEMLASIAEVAGDMAGAARSLNQQYTEEVDKIQEILEDTFTAKDGEQQKKKEMKDKIDNFNSLIAKAEAAKRNAMEAEQKAEYFFEQARHEQQKALEEQASPWKRAINFVTSMVGFEAFDLGAYKNAAEAAAGEKYRFLEEMQRYQNIRIEALKEIAEFTERIKHCDDNTKLAHVVLDSLRSAMGGLKNVAIVMLDAALFWDSMRGHCEKLGLRKEIDYVLKGNKETWRSDYFKKRAVRFLAKWVALHSICKEFRGNLQLTQKELRSVLRENPTNGEALENVRQLAKEFGPQLAKAINQIESDQEKLEAEVKSTLKKDEL